jgi:hypothetical protein
VTRYLKKLPIERASGLKNKTFWILRSWFEASSAPRVKGIVLKWEWRTAIRWTVNGAPFVYKKILFLIPKGSVFLLDGTARVF